MKNLVVIACYFLLIFLLRCQNKTEREGLDISDQFKTYLKSIERPVDRLERNTYLIVPSDICPTCIEKIKNYILSEPNSRYTIFILPGRSYKNIRLTFTDEVISLDNVWLDESGEWYKNVLLSQYEVAQLFYTSNNEVMKRISLYPADIDFSLFDLSNEYGKE